MLRQTFIHIPGIGKDTEKGMWAQGCADWETYLANPNEFKVGSASREVVKKTLERSQVALDRGEHQYFRKKLGQKDAWRSFADFKHSVAYLDIETDGGRNGQSVTVVGIYDGEFKAFVKGENLESFRDAQSEYSLLVTYFGTGFDIPVLEKRFKGLIWDQIHIDLCHQLRFLGYKGGLKKIEKEVGIERPEEINGLTGWDAVVLWRKHLSGDEKALPLLLEYNKADVVNLERLGELAYEKMKLRVCGEPTLFTS